MHEAAIAESVLKTILGHAETMKARPVRAVISCGQFNAVNDEVMQLAFEAAAMETVAEGMKLVIRHIPLRAKCKKCQTVFEFDIYDPICKSCRSMEFHFEPDAPLLLEDIDFEETP